MSHQDLFVQSLGNVHHFEVAVVISQGGGEVMEGYRVFDADTEKQAVMQAYNYYEDDGWEFERLRYIKKVYKREVQE